MARRDRDLRDSKQGMSWTPIILIVGLVVGIPALAAIVIGGIIFAISFMAVKAGREAVDDLQTKVIAENKRLAEERAKKAEEERIRRQKELDDMMKIKPPFDPWRDKKDPFDPFVKNKLPKEIPNLPAPPRAPGTNQIDLIAMIDIPRDKIHGDHWSKVGSELHCTEAFVVPRIEIPYMPPEEYDYIVKFSQPGLRNGISLIMPNPTGGSFFWYCARGAGEHGFQAKPREIEQRAPGIVRPNTMHTTIVQVRKNSVRALLDGKELMNFQTNYTNLTSDNWRKINDTRLLAIACDDRTVFHELRVVEVTGQGKWMR